MSVEQYKEHQEKNAPARPTKYQAVPTEVDGIKFPSKKEANRYRQLALLVKAGEISGLRLQVSYDISVNEHHICRYIADFEYVTSHGAIVTEDVKGMRTPVYKLKKKLMLAVHGIEITES